MGERGRQPVPEWTVEEHLARANELAEQVEDQLHNWPWSRTRAVSTLAMLHLSLAREKRMQGDGNTPGPHGLG